MAVYTAALGIGSVGFWPASAWAERLFASGTHRLARFNLSCDMFYYCRLSDPCNMRRMPWSSRIVTSFANVIPGRGIK
jgi:hypothetical protein